MMLSLRRMLALLRRRMLYRFKAMRCLFSVHLAMRYSHARPGMLHFFCLLHLQKAGAVAGVCIRRQGQLMSSRSSRSSSTLLRFGFRHRPVIRVTCARPARVSVRLRVSGVGMRLRCGG
jgi:hypothetical protein